MCIDGNFEHKRCRHAGKGDQPLPEHYSVFIPEDFVADVANEVASRRSTRPHHLLEDDEDAVFPGLELPNHIFDGCDERFFAAKESNRKADSSAFSDTGLMALVCRHDHVIFMVNLHDAGEKQYSVLALIKQLFLELPKAWNVGILYDIGCTLHKSITKVCFICISYFSVIFIRDCSTIYFLITGIESHLVSLCSMRLDMGLDASVYITRKNELALAARMVRDVKDAGVGW